MLGLGLGLEYARSRGGGGGGDANFNKTVLLLGFNGADGATTTLDESFKARGAPIFHNQAQLDTAQAKFGASSLLLDGTDKIVYPSSVDFDFGALDFTVEGWFRAADLTGFRTLIARADTAGFGSFFIDVINGNQMRFQVNLETDGITGDVWSMAASTATWYHYAMSRQGNAIRHYFNGSYLGKRTTTRAIAVEVRDLTIGAFTEAASGTTNGFNGHLDEPRITKGAAIYTTEGAYTPPATAFPRS